MRDSSSVFKHACFSASSFSRISSEMRISFSDINSACYSSSASILDSSAMRDSSSDFSCKYSFYSACHIAARARRTSSSTISCVILCSFTFSLASSAILYYSSALKFACSSASDLALTIQYLSLNPPPPPSVSLQGKGRSHVLAKQRQPIYKVVSIRRC